MPGCCWRSAVFFTTQPSANGSVSFLLQLPTDTQLWDWVRERAEADVPSLILEHLSELLHIVSPTHCPANPLWGLRTPPPFQDTARDGAHSGISGRFRLEPQLRDTSTHIASIIKTYLWIHPLGTTGSWRCPGNNGLPITEFRIQWIIGRW